MKVMLLVLICVLCSSSPELLLNTNQSTATMTTSHKVSITFSGTVKSIEPLGKRELRVIPVDFDSKFAVTVHIESVTPGEVPLEGGTDQVFAVHSPARLFGAVKEDIVGKKYRFKVTWNGVRHRFSELTARPEPER
jgi:hypothetical protein